MGRVWSSDREAVEEIKDSGVTDMIDVGLYGVARLKAGVSHFETNVKTLQELKGMLPGISRKEANDLIVLVNGKSVKKNYHFQENDKVTFMSPAGGG